ncbi:coiled-coil domain-containing protein [Nesterenkonia halotolerans]|uniref:F0F1-type ATP synthase membrane subunit b/b n=1 Tax=Nesterenkonia halotolerans TaxID=225325 RepID=A0ABR9J9S5_9MICC|nr:Rho termination factor N-terminal domain-containing protein [Nesterenkonia halotolerans]MBE1515752.1 F0F1-type ATP synthase membrane subunit b/b' [Nesterenkonia halotolerans]
MSQDSGSEEAQGSGPLGWFTRKAKEGIADIPANIAWLVKGAPSGSSGDDSSGPGQRAREVIADTVPFGKDSLDVRIKRAQDALADARRSEQQAVELSQDAKERSETAKQVAEEGRRRKAQAEKENKAEVNARVKEAQKRADEMVAKERSEAESDASENLEQVTSEIRDQNEKAQDEAQAAKERAEAAVESAIEEMTEARKLADDAAAQAREAAEEAHRQAEALADRAGERAEEADATLAETQEIHAGVSKESATVVQEVQTNEVTEDLASYTKADLLKLATNLDIQGRNSMLKSDLITAIEEAR